MTENFLEHVTKEETEKFKKSLSQCNDLNNDALKALNNINIDNFLSEDKKQNKNYLKKREKRV